jgi:hypothetical protein
LAEQTQDAAPRRLLIKDQAGNNFAGLTSPTALNFSTMVSSSTPTVLITEVNSNAVGGDFFELFNYGATEIDLSGWKWDDDSANPASGATFPPGTKIAAGQRIVVLTESIDAASFKTAWGGLTGVTVVTAATAPSGLGLGGSGDAVVLFDASGRTITWFNYKTTHKRVRWRSEPRAMGRPDQLGRASPTGLPAHSTR